MSVYVIGDVQGCFAPLQKLLEKIQFDISKDVAWFTGDLVNRGSQSLEVLRFVKSLGKNQQIVLGNHDLHLLALAHNAHSGWKEDTLQPILSAPDRDELIDWLCQQPLLHHDEISGFTMVHAGIAASWNLTTAKNLAQEIAIILQHDTRAEFFRYMYGNEPTTWNEKLTSWERARCITNYFTRARFCYPDGSLELSSKGTLSSHPQNLVPWFQVPNRKTIDNKIIFGHWAALSGVTNTANVFALDTGCVWGYCLTAMRLEDGKRFSVGCQCVT